MKALQRAALLIVLLLGLPTLLVAQQPLAQATAAVVRPSLTPEQMEQFLLKAKIIATKGVNKGINNTRRATLTDGAITHDAQIQTVDISKFVFVPARGNSEVNFRDSYRYNIAGYQLARLVGLANVPVSVERQIQRDTAAVTWWIDDVLMDEGERRKKPTPEWVAARTSSQIHIMRVFDELIANTDRNLGNLLWTTDGTMWMIDHTRAFRLQKTLKNPALLQRCERGLLEGMRSLSLENLKKAMGDALTKPEIEAVLARRDLIVKLFDDKIAQGGEASALYTLEPR